MSIELLCLDGKKSSFCRNNLCIHLIPYPTMSRSLIFASRSIYHFQSEELKQKMRILLVKIHRIQ